jgi:hypothetical protein
LSAVNNAQRLYQFPLGVLAISLATAAFPLFSLYASRGDMDNLRSSVTQSLRLAIYVGLPSGVMIILLANPLVSLLFEHGRFGPEQTARAAAILRWYGIGMAAFCCQHILLRAFYSLKDTLTPMRISCTLVLLSIAMNLTLVWHPAIRERTFGISTAIVACLHVCVSVWLLRRRMEGRLGATAIGVSVLRTAVASGAAGAVEMPATMVTHWCAFLHRIQSCDLVPAFLHQKHDRGENAGPLAGYVADFVPCLFEPLLGTDERPSDDLRRRVHACSGRQQPLSGRLVAGSLATQAPSPDSDRAGSASPARMESLGRFRHHGICCPARLNRIRGD